MHLIIVESPTKAKTISKFLDKSYQVESSFGHVRDLPKSEMGIDLTGSFEPKYVVPTKSKAIVTKLKKLASTAESVILASDEDREGEAIAWHLAEILKIKHNDAKRIAFHEITKPAIMAALEHPRKLDLKLVDAQQARRILDRLVGYELSPFLWKKVAKGLSAGRVQSVAVRLVVEREREILAFKKDEYWTVAANLLTIQKNNLEAQLIKIDNKKLGKLSITNGEQAQEIATNLRNQTFSVSGIEKKSAKKSAPIPFTTSTLQQAANRMYGWSAKQTMMIAQQLYEGIDLGQNGSTGLITYMRTDSLNLSSKFLSEAHDYLNETLGKEYTLAQPRVFKTKSKGAQEAHEAIRPTEAKFSPESLEKSLNPNQYRLYKLIWARSVASQMPDAIIEQTKVTVTAGIYELLTEGQILKFDGYLKIYQETSKDVILPNITEGEILECQEIKPEQHFTKPPARYSDAGLIKELEKHGIGRPSTYAPTIATIEERNYVERDEAKKLKPTDIAFVVIDLLVKHFPDIVDIKFTANIENDLDRVATGKIDWKPMMRNFYEPFHANLESKYTEVNKEDIVPEEKTEEICEKCKSPMIVKTGRYGKFLACTGYPECKNIKPMPGAATKETSPEASAKMQELMEKHKDEVCDKCQSPMVVKTGRFGVFLACSSYPKCKNVKNLEEASGDDLNLDCPVCGKGKIVKKRSRFGFFYSCNNYPECKTAYWGKPTGEKCPECESLLIEGKGGIIKCSQKGCSFEKADTQKATDEKIPDETQD